MSLSSIIDIHKERKKKENEIFKTVYKRVEQNIIYNVSIGSKACIYTIPEAIWGYPLIDIPRTMEYLLYKLNKRDFICVQLDPRNIYITWNLDTIKKKTTEKSKVIFENSYENSYENDDEINVDKDKNKDKKISIFDIIINKSKNKK